MSEEVNEVVDAVEETEVPAEEVAEEVVAEEVKA